MVGGWFVSLHLRPHPRRRRRPCRRTSAPPRSRCRLGRNVCTMDNKERRGGPTGSAMVERSQPWERSHVVVSSQCANLGFVQQETRRGKRGNFPWPAPVSYSRSAAMSLSPLADIASAVHCRAPACCKTHGFAPGNVPAGCQTVGTGGTCFFHVWPESVEVQMSPASTAAASLVPSLDDAMAYHCFP